MTTVKQKIDVETFVSACIIYRNHRSIGECLGIKPRKVLLMRDRLIAMGVHVPPLDRKREIIQEAIISTSEVARLNEIISQCPT